MLNVKTVLYHTYTIHFTATSSSTSTCNRQWRTFMLLNST